MEFGRGNGAVADALYQTAEPDIFVGGDVYTGPKFAIDAIAAGKTGRNLHPSFCTATFEPLRSDVTEMISSS